MSSLYCTDYFITGCMLHILLAKGWASPMQVLGGAERLLPLGDCCRRRLPRGGEYTLSELLCSEPPHISKAMSPARHHAPDGTSRSLE